MASYHHFLEHTTARFDSPAKLFAKLKSKVQREEMCAREPLCNVGDKHGAHFKSPRKRSESTWRNEEIKENKRIGSYRHEAQALTLSPISSPQKTFAHLYSGISGSNRPVEEMPPLTDIGGRCTQTQTAFLESTAMCHPLSQVNRKRIHSETPRNKGAQDGFLVSSRTPVKTETAGEDFVRRVLEEQKTAALDRLMSPSCVYSPMRKRLRKRTLEPHDLNKVSSSTKEVKGGPRERRTTASALSEDDTRIDDVGDARGFSNDLSEMNRFAHGPVLPPRLTPNKRCCLLAMEREPPMSPAKMFAYMKERESKAEQQEVHKVSSSTTHLLDGGDFNQCRDSPPSTPHSVCETEDSVFRSPPESVAHATRPTVESADSQSDTDPTGDFRIPAPPPQIVLFEDPLVLNTPRVSIPKKRELVIKRNKFPQLTKFPSESKIYLKRWFLRKTHKGLFLDGIHRDDKVPWNSNIIAHRISNTVVKTVSGSVYILVGKMNLDCDLRFPMWFLKKFVSGFPPDWKELYDKLLSESRSSDSGREAKSHSERRGVRAKTKSETSSINMSVKGHRPNSLKTPQSCPPPSSSSSTKVSRSGRVIKPPLEYWRGGRVLVDAYMNVTVHECYETSICLPEVKTTVSERVLQKPASVSSKGQEQSQSSNDEEGEAWAPPLRKVKVSLRRSNRSRVQQPEEKPSHSSKSAVKTLSSPDESSGRPRRSSRGRQASEYLDPAPQKHREPEKSSTRRSRKQTPETTQRLARASRNKRAVSSFPETAPVHDKTSQERSSEDKFPSRREKKKTHRKTRPSRAFPSSQSSDCSEESGQEEPKKRTKGTKNSKSAPTQIKPRQSKCTKISPPTKPLPKSTTSSGKRKTRKGNTLSSQEEEEDVWTPRRERGRNVLNKTRQSRVFPSSQSSDCSEESGQEEPKKRTKGTKNSKSAPTQIKPGQRKCTKISPPTKPLPTTSSSKHKTSKGNALSSPQEEEDAWTEAELMKLQEAVSSYPKYKLGYWAKVASAVGTRSAEECHKQHTSRVPFQPSAKKPQRAKKQNKEAPKEPVLPVISARVGTLKRKQQVREFLETMPREDVEDGFSSAYMQNKRFEMPPMSPSDDNDFAMSDLEPLTPKSSAFPEVKTPQCLYITPGMMGSPNKTNNDKYVYQLQKRMKKNQFKVGKLAPSSKSHTPTPSAKRTMKRCGNTENDNFVVWELFPGKEGALSDSGEEEDFYFSDD